jgi:hypothetical protein
MAILMITAKDAPDSHENLAKFVLAGPIFLLGPKVVRAKLKVDVSGNIQSKTGYDTYLDQLSITCSQQFHLQARILIELQQKNRLKLERATLVSTKSR